MWERFWQQSAEGSPRLRAERKKKKHEQQNIMARPCYRKGGHKKKANESERLVLYCVKEVGSVPADCGEKVL